MYSAMHFDCASQEIIYLHTYFQDFCLTYIPSYLSVLPTASTLTEQCWRKGQKVKERTGQNYENEVATLHIHGSFSGGGLLFARFLKQVPPQFALINEHAPYLCLLTKSGRR